MDRCPKCGSREITGPRYCKSCSYWPQEHLHYRCMTCGYTNRAPCQDAERK